jgi:predicted ABC-type sugar transport system permease subunit
MEKKKVFRSRISVLLIVLMLLTLVPVFIWVVPPLIRYENFTMLWFFGGIMLFSLLLPILLLGGMRYVISGGKLLIKICSIPCGSVEIADIVSVKRSYNPLSSPAASLKRLQIFCAIGGGCLISPVREQEFIETLKAINPDIQVDVPDKKGIWRMQDWNI